MRPPCCGGRPILFGGALAAFLETTNHLYDAALTLVYPQACQVCGSSVESRVEGVACRKCWLETRLFSGNDLLCWKCGGLALVGSDIKVREEVRCHRCQELSFTAARAGGVYEGALRASIIALKRNPCVSEKVVGGMIAVARRTPLDRATLILPVPLHPDREKERGFNQAAVLATVLAKRLQLPFAENALARIVHTERHRAGMDALARRRSVERAFVVLQPRSVVGESVLLIDDVYTTGATVSACAEALLAAAAKEVLVLTLARPRNS
jgi:ComF family protein